VYEIPTGEIHCLDPASGSFRPLLVDEVEAVAA
jgi:hypothetical protein